ncbi:uncharacterized protein BXZ73DRAFT_52831 [Epithele typhae]|uniref:uncharacterized protein n=1 Tax=Epithele typhae TaxID=378194 RepID=UPI00200881A2|nr:uncharacterized protein BXZ73DRAFT_52831 [Epithele typhae]KAH9918761.1 hypothetical protein BXZ73DRAFT_52831 [Epithele typhae]
MPEPPPAEAATTAAPRANNAPRQRPRRDGQPSDDRAQPGPGGSHEPNDRADGAGRPRRPRRPKQRDGQASTPFQDGTPSSGGPSHNGGRRGGRGGGGGRGRPASGPSDRPHHPIHRGKPVGDSKTPPSGQGTPTQNGKELGDASSAAEPRKPRNRRRDFNSELTEGGSSDATGHVHQSSTVDKYRYAVPKGDDLTSRLIAELSAPPYQDCLICFAPITPMQPTWSCSPSSPTMAAEDEEGAGSKEPRVGTGTQCCWVTFHLKCIREWAQKSVKDIEDAWRARGEEKQGDWRCPGCQSKRTAIPSSYWCFCGSAPDPRPPRLATPHSCANPCSRARPCGHPCPFTCHPGPCPPCQVTTSLPCYCGKETLSFRCSNLGRSRRGGPTTAELTCGQTCGRKLGCGNHPCQDVCHSGKCAPCPVRDKARCYCGKEEQELACGEGEEKESVVATVEGVEQWVGRYTCKGLCNRPFDCGTHHCQKPCHPPSITPAPCPRSPSLVTHCPCGKHPLNPESAPFFPSRTKLVRASCADPVPTCESTCMKPLGGCEHVCSAKCHTGPCPPCSIRLVRPCRCGLTKSQILCSESQAQARARARGETGPESEILCERPCTAHRSCGRHQCSRICCPLASLAAANKKGKKRAGADNLALEDPEGWHECDIICGKMLSCGNHRCEERDHKGGCPPCLRSSFEEMICHCGRTTLEPPIPCGTRIACKYPCTHPPPPCGHPKAQHACHEDPARCLPCVYLTSKMCACGKKMVDNVKCSQEKISCGTACGKLLACGFHHCERPCHGDACGTCQTTCGKSRKLCFPAQHPCTLPCHAPASCEESEPCRSIVTISCPCGRIRQSVPCGRSVTSNSGREGSQQLKCSNECGIAKRNARLAEALGINPERAEGRSAQVTYSEDLISFARANGKFCTLVEKTFADFLSSDKKSHLLPHMPEQKRKFVHDLATAYRLDTQMVDQEPYRSVQLLRRLDSRVPAPLLSAAATPSGLGKLADLRAASRPSSAFQMPARASPTPSGAGRGWTSVVARPSQPASPAPSSWGAAPTPAPTRPATVSAPAPRTVLAPIPAPAVPEPATPVDVPDDWEDAV